MIGAQKKIGSYEKIYLLHELVMLYLNNLLKENASDRNHLKEIRLFTMHQQI